MWQTIGAIIIGAVAGLIARLISPAPSNPRGFLLTTVLGIGGGVVATWLGRAVHLYGPDQQAGLLASIVGAIIVLAVWRLLIRHRYGGGYPPNR
ncbi:MAG: GlsB/YeaQ/YmgE family stress response membrane protein [Alphaproteobacteria bacterium]|nr:GlsB/YeaQ/YmgE family stress response membrane protein [Alphaproteobacteria bacterium]